MSGNKQILYVFLATNKVAQIQLINDEHQWRYDKRWLQSGFALSPHLPLNQAIVSINTQRFLTHLTHHHHYPF